MGGGGIYMSLTRNNVGFLVNDIQPLPSKLTRLGWKMRNLHITQQFCDFVLTFLRKLTKITINDQIIEFCSYFARDQIKMCFRFFFLVNDMQTFTRKGKRLQNPSKRAVSISWSKLWRNVLKRMKNQNFPISIFSRY